MIELRRVDRMACVSLFWGVYFCGYDGRNSQKKHWQEMWQEMLTSDF